MGAEKHFLAPSIRPAQANLVNLEAPVMEFPGIMMELLQLFDPLVRKGEPDPKCMVAAKRYKQGQLVRHGVQDQHEGELLHHTGFLSWLAVSPTVFWYSVDLAALKGPRDLAVGKFVPAGAALLANHVLNRKLCARLQVIVDVFHPESIALGELVVIPGIL